jgi:hypothetical protein
MKYNEYAGRYSCGSAVTHADVDSGQIMIGDVAVLTEFTGAADGHFMNDGVVIKHDLAPGYYKVWVEHDRHWGCPASVEVGTSVYHGDVDKFEVVLVKSDLLFFGDPCYVLNDDSEKGEAHYDLACEVSLSPLGYGNIGDTGIFVTSSGLGDGTYRVDADDLTIYFLNDPWDEEDEEEEEEEEDEDDDDDEDDDE